jgi:hypothetical protein
MSFHPNESNEGSRICAKAVDFERSVPVAEPDTLKGSFYSHDFVPTALVPCSGRVVLLEFN